MSRRLRRHRQLAVIQAYHQQLADLISRADPGWIDVFAPFPVRLRAMRRAQERLLRPRGALPGLRPRPLGFQPWPAQIG